MDTMPIDAPRQAGIYVRRAREAQGLTRVQLAVAAGVSERLLASLELGDATGIRLDKLLAVFGALGISLAAQGDALAADAGPRVATSSPRLHPASVPSSATSVRRAISDDFIDYGAALRDFIVNDMGIKLASGEA